MPEHIKFILRHAAWGGLAAVVFVALLLWFNVANLWHLVTHTAEGPIALIAMTIFFGITFGSAQVGYKIMTIGEDDTPKGGKRDAIPTQLVPIPVRADDRR
jgi:hypothetical protein